MGSVQTLEHTIFKQISEMLFVSSSIWKLICEILVSIRVVTLKLKLANRHFKTFLSIQIASDHQESSIDWKNICFSV